MFSFGTLTRHNVEAIKRVAGPNVTKHDQIPKNKEYSRQILVECCHNTIEDSRDYKNSSDNADNKSTEERKDKSFSISTQ